MKLDWILRLLYVHILTFQKQLNEDTLNKYSFYTNFVVEQFQYFCFQSLHCPKVYPVQMDDQQIAETIRHLEGNVVANGGLFGCVYGDCHDDILAASQSESSVVPKLLRLSLTLTFSHLIGIFFTIVKHWVFWAQTTMCLIWLYNLYID